MLVATEPKMKMDGAWLIVEAHRLYKNDMNTRGPPRPAKRQSSDTGVQIQRFKDLR